MALIFEVFQAMAQLEREIDIMKLIDHDHCIKLFNVFNTSTHIYLVLELMTGGELFDRIIAKVSSKHLSSLLDP